jgi:hypothetical protein
MFAPSFFEQLEDRLNLAVYDTNEELRMALKLQGLGSKLGLLKHNLELDAEKLSTEIDAADTERVTVMAQASESVAAHRKDLAEVKAFVAEVKEATNGAPADPASPTPVPGPYPSYP